MINKKEKPINVYWSGIPILESMHEVSFLYPKPKTLFSELIDKKNKESTDPKNSYLSCPAFSSKFKKTLVFKNNMDSSYEYSVASDQEPYLKFIDKPQHITGQITRPSSITDGPTILFNLSYIFFADEPLEIYLTPPMFHEPQYMKYGSVVPGEFDIGQWFRPINFEVQMWKESGRFYLKQDEPLMYLEFKTKRSINLQRFNMNEKLYSYQTATSNSYYFFGAGKPLSDKYKQFKNVGYREKILKEIKSGLIDEEPYKF